MRRSTNHESTPRAIRFPPGSKKRVLLGASRLFRERLRHELDKDWSEIALRNKDIREIEAERRLRSKPLPEN